VPWSLSSELQVGDAPQFLVDDRKQSVSGSVVGAALEKEISDGGLSLHKPKMDAVLRRGNRAALSRVTGHRNVAMSGFHRIVRLPPVDDHKARAREASHADRRVTPSIDLGDDK
jgi:hypothetical protein